MTALKTLARVILPRVLVRHLMEAAMIGTRGLSATQLASLQKVRKDQNGRFDSFT